MGAGFLAGFALAQSGAYLSFVPLLQILVPLQAEAIDPAHKSTLLAQALFWGALTAGLSNFAAGALSDRTRSPLGRRRPWMLGGLVGMMLAYMVIARADAPGALVAGVVLFQLTFNSLFAALLAVLPDRVPNAQKGWVSALLGMGFPVGAFLGTALVGAWPAGAAERWTTLAVAVSMAILPFAAMVKDVASPRWTAKTRRPRFRLRALFIDPWTHPDFALAWGGRFLVVFAHTLAQVYLLYYLQDHLHYGRMFPGQRAEQGLAVMTAVWSVASVGAGLLCGRLSDRLRRRKLFAILGALALALALAGFFLSEAWGQVLLASLIFGGAIGCYYTVDLALVAQVLPSDEDAGKDLGLINLSNTLPQVLAPALAVWLVGPLHLGVRSLFVVAAIACCLGAAVIQRIRSVR